MDQAAPVTPFNLLSAIDEALKGFLSAPGRSDLVVALVADDSLPVAVNGDRRNFVCLLEGLLEAALQSTRAAELLLEVTLLEEDRRFAWIRFSAADDCTHLGREPRSYAAIYLAWRLEKAPANDAVRGRLLT